MVVSGSFWNDDEWFENGMEQKEKNWKILLPARRRRKDESERKYSTLFSMVKSSVRPSRFHHDPLGTDRHLKQLQFHVRHSSATNNDATEVTTWKTTIK